MNFQKERLVNASNWFGFTAGIVALASIATVVAPTARAAPFSGGSLVVERVGDGTTALSAAAAQISVLEVTKAGSLTQTIILPSSGSNQQTDAGSISQGYLNTYGGYVSVPGYNAAAGTASVASSNTKVNSLLDVTGTVVTRTLFPTTGTASAPYSPFSGNSHRSSIATSGSTFYGTGASSGSPNTGGAWYVSGTTFTQVSSTATGQPTNLRNVEIYNNQLYASSAASTGFGIWSIGSGLPTTAANTSTLAINTGNSASLFGFVMFSTGSQGSGVLDLAYIADDRTTAGGGLEKWTLSGTTWTNSWSLLVSGTAIGSSTLQSGTATNFAGLRGLAGTYDSVLGASLYATTTENSNNRLISILDNRHGDTFDLHDAAVVWIELCLPRRGPLPCGCWSKRAHLEHDERNVEHVGDQLAGKRFRQSGRLHPGRLSHVQRHRRRNRDDLGIDAALFDHGVRDERHVHLRLLGRESPHRHDRAREERRRHADPLRQFRLQRIDSHHRRHNPRGGRRGPRHRHALARRRHDRLG
jgi:hypothetical protein